MKPHIKHVTAAVAGTVGCAAIASTPAWAGAPEPQPQMYVSNGGTVAALDGTTGQVEGTVRGVFGSLAAGSGGGPVYGAVLGNGARRNQIALIDTSNVRIAGSFNATASAGQAANTPGRELAVQPNGPLLFQLVQPRRGPAAVAFIDTRTYRMVGTVRVGRNPGDIQVSPDGTKLYVANQGEERENGPVTFFVNSTITVIDVPRRRVETTIRCQDFAPTSLAITPDGDTLYVGNNFDGGPESVGVIDTQTNRVTQQLNLPGGGANGVALTPDGRTLYVSMSDSNNLVVVSTATNTVTTSLPAPPGAEAIIGVAPIATTTDGRHVFINAYTPGSGGVAQSVLAIVSTATNTVTGTVSTSGGQSAGMNLLGLTPPNVLARATGATSTATVNRRGQVSLRTSCPRSSGTPNCIGRVALVTRTGGVPLGAAPFNARAGRTVTSRISLSRAARRMVGRRGLAAFTVTQTNQPGGGAVLSNRNVRLRR